MSTCPRKVERSFELGYSGTADLSCIVEYLEQHIVVERGDCGHFLEKVIIRSHKSAMRETYIAEAFHVCDGRRVKQKAGHPLDSVEGRLSMSKTVRKTQDEVRVLT